MQYNAQILFKENSPPFSIISSIAGKNKAWMKVIRKGAYNLRNYASNLRSRLSESANAAICFAMLDGGREATQMHKQKMRKRIHQMNSTNESELPRKIKTRLVSRLRRRPWKTQGPRLKMKLKRNKMYRANRLANCSLNS
ncbi:MAG: hypothetical protein IPL91_02460 [Hyphomicrobium sp.]|nr:hypothetical protein [Hyphomicrobium sp.]